MTPPRQFSCFIPAQKGPNTEDTFGKSDADWEIYRGISKDVLSEEEDEYQQQLGDLEELISAADPSMNED